jgi:head-tail adaptor
MPVRPPEHDFRVDNSSWRVQDTVRNEKTHLVKYPCPNHEYRSRTKRMGQVAKYCALCMDQQDMAARWKSIRKAVATIRCFNRKSSVAAKAASAKTEWEVSIVRTAGPPTATKGMRLLVVINCSQGR